MNDRALIQARAAEMAGVHPRTWRRWFRDGKTPPPDGVLPSGKDFWWESTIKRAFTREREVA